MAYITEVIDNGTGLHRVGQGVITGRELIDAAKAAWESRSDLAPITHALIDFTNIDRFECSAKEIVTVANLMAKIGETVKGAYVAIAAADDVAFGMCRMFGSLVDRNGWIIMTFRTIDEAKAWLDYQLGLVVPAGKI
jgi:hypothetical protein